MSESVGKNTPNAEKLRGFVDELERIDAMKKDLTEQAKVIKATAKSQGFSTEAIAYLMKVRKIKPHDFQDATTIRDVYLHAMDMLPEPPLFRQLATLVDDAASQDSVTEALKQLAPAKGDIVLRMGDKPMRIFRDAEGEAKVEPYVEAKPKPVSASGIPERPVREVPDASLEEAFAMGFDAAKANTPVIDNPFPYGDERRAKWDAGWRKGNGGDGFGQP
jgi:uncharacterized protein (UPF0335 family)